MKPLSFAFGPSQRFLQWLALEVAHRHLGRDRLRVDLVAILCGAGTGNEIRPTGGFERIMIYVRREGKRCGY
jgi:hypothetical protein